MENMYAVNKLYWYGPDVVASSYFHNRDLTVLLRAK
jgi:hypothetical protein